MPGLVPRTGESPAYWLPRHMTGTVCGKDHDEAVAGVRAGQGVGATPPTEGNPVNFTQLHLLSYGYIL
ncbi:hypothetical protein C3488_22975 [Streptomyces sp. Ru72]|nr:hypothetical protein C3488_22975 [Streptomyces sp. Ru72]